MFTITESDVDDRLFSPYSEEAIDNDSLYLLLCAQRRAHCSSMKTIETSAPGALFSPTDGKNDMDWRSLIF